MTTPAGWSDDDKSTPVGHLPNDKCHEVNVNGRACLIDGNRAHEVAPFKGQRRSIVGYSCKKSWDISSDVRNQLLLLGAIPPHDISECAPALWFRQPFGYKLDIDGPVPIHWDIGSHAQYVTVSSGGSATAAVTVAAAAGISNVKR